MSPSSIYLGRFALLGVDCAAAYVKAPSTLVLFGDGAGLSDGESTADLLDAGDDADMGRCEEDESAGEDCTGGSCFGTIGVAAAVEAEEVGLVPEGELRVMTEPLSGRLRAFFGGERGGAGASSSELEMIMGVLGRLEVAGLGLLFKVWERKMTEDDDEKADRRAPLFD